MVSIKRQGDRYEFIVQGMHQLWAVRSRISVADKDVVCAYPNTERVDWIWGLRLLGTHIPGIITAGTYRVDGRTVFYDVVNPKRSIVVELRNTFFDRLVIEVQEVQQAIDLLEQGSVISKAERSN
jgi:hypothetical protein